MTSLKKKQGFALGLIFSFPGFIICSLYYFFSKNKINSQIKDFLLWMFTGSFTIPIIKLIGNFFNINFVSFLASALFVFGFIFSVFYTYKIYKLNKK